MNKAIKALPREAQGIVQALQAQLAESQKVIQAQAMELKFKGQIEAGWMQVEREKIDKQSGVKVHDTQVKSDTQVLTQTMKDTTARDVAEIHGATQLLNTNTEAAHDRRAAEQMIDNAVRTEKRPNGAG
jgi:ethanolamine utilization protein EutQ (cupin superfamily)